MVVAAERLAPIARDRTRGIYARIVSARAVATVGGADALHAMWAALNASGKTLPRRLLAELAEGAAPGLRSVELLLASLDMRRRAYERAVEDSDREWSLTDVLSLAPGAVASREPVNARTIPHPSAQRSEALGNS